MRVRWPRPEGRALAAAAAVLAACGHPGAPRPPGPAASGAPLVVEAPGFVSTAGGPPQLDVTLRNASDAPVAVPRPTAAYVLLEAQRGAQQLLCRDTPPPAAQAVTTLPPGGRVTVHVDVGERCGVRGLDRYSLRVYYVVPPSRDLARTWSGMAGPAQVEAAPTPTAAAVPVPVPPPGAELPGTGAGGAPREAAPPPPPPVAAPDTTLPPGPPPAPLPVAPPAAAVQAARDACVDRELSRRGLNAWGDPPGTRYPGGEPADLHSTARTQYVLRHVPEIHTACAAPEPTGF